MTDNEPWRDQYTLYRCTAHGWACYGHSCPKCAPVPCPLGSYQAEFAKQLRERPNVPSRKHRRYDRLGVGFLEENGVGFYDVDKDL